MSERKANIVELDVRPLLRKKMEPFQMIMDTVKSLKEDDLFVLHATFKPTPLFGMLKLRGYVHQVEKRAQDHWVVTFVKRKYRHLLNADDDMVAETESEAISEVDAGSQVKESANAKAVPNREKQIIELDNRGLQPPQPMMRTLNALERSQPGDEVRIHNDRVPVFLIEELQQLGYHFTVEEQTDGSAKVIIVKN